MPSYCCVTNCANRRLRDNLKFYRIPGILNFPHKRRLSELSKLRREKWISAIKRADLIGTKAINAAVCSQHFITGKPARLEDDLDPDWVPSLNMGYEMSSVINIPRQDASLECPSTSLECPATSLEYPAASLECPAMTLECPATSLECPATEEVSESSGNVEGNSDPRKLLYTELHRDQDKSSQTDLDLAELSLLLTKLSASSEKILELQKKTLCTNNLKHDDNLTKYYTGLPSYKVFEVVVKYIKPFVNIHGKVILPPVEQILLTLIKLRLNLDFKDLAFRFGISQSTASTYFKAIVHIMSQRFKSLIVWPERSTLLKTMPQCFKDSFQEKTTVIIDCFEIRCETPSNLLVAAQCWSNYKHSETIKYLIGITPQGSVSFISEGWGGRISDKCLTQNSKFLSKLSKGDVVLADRGFLIKEFVELFQATVKVPAFTRGKSQLHPIDLENTRAIAHVRIHVERIIGLLRKKYRIIQGPLPITLLATRGDKSIVDEIVLVCSALINICPPIVPLS